MTAPARPQLTELETTVLRLAASGATIGAIARTLGSSMPAVQDTRHRLMAKLGARNITHAVHIGHSRGLLWRDCEGDRASYLRHLHRGEPTHEACRAANTRHNAEQRAKRARERATGPLSRPNAAPGQSGPSGSGNASGAPRHANRPANQTNDA